MKKMENKSLNKKCSIIGSTAEILLYILLCVLPVVWLFAFGIKDSVYIFHIRLGLFLLSLILRGIFSAIEIFKVSKIKAIGRIILVLALFSVIFYISYVGYMTSIR